MARILTNAAGGTRRISIEGPLSFRDLRLLEHACGAALEHAHLAIEIQLDGVTHIDDHARAYLDRLVSRGAVISTRDS